MRVFFGNVVNPKTPFETHFFERCLLGVSTDGTIAFVEDLDVVSISPEQLQRSPEIKSLAYVLSSAFPKALDIAAPEKVAAVLVREGWKPESDELHVLPSDCFLSPGFIDTHTHACQVPNVGLGQQYELLDWLQHITFPQESKLKDATYAKKVYKSVVDRFLRLGTTTACIYASLHLEASKTLMRICHEFGLRAFIGRCQMDRHSPDWYKEPDADTSCKHTRELISYSKELCGPLETASVQPILTPRFAICCTPELMHGIGSIAREYPALRIQTHLSENIGEINFTQELFPGNTSYTGVYDHFGLLNERTILAHAIHISDEEIRLIEERKCGLSHCPTSNINLRSGLFRLVHMLDRGVKVGLGTDVSGGYSLGMLPVIRETSTVAKMLAMSEAGLAGGTTTGEHNPGATKSAPLSPATLFYLATLGGARVCELADRIGSFERGKEFDALVVNLHIDKDVSDAATNPNVYAEHADPLGAKFEKWLFCGDDRNIGAVFTSGRLVSGTLSFPNTSKQTAPHA